MWGYTSVCSHGQLQLAHNPGLRRLGLVDGSGFAVAIELGSLSFNSVSFMLPSVKAQGISYVRLLTPPETPLFHSLDDEEYQRIGMAHRGRAQIKPISISRSSTMDSTRRSNRSSASPSRLSPSPRSCTSTVFTRTRSSNSSSRCSTPLALQPATPSWRSSTPPASKTLTPPRRSPSPASRRMSTGSSDPISNGRRRNSPVKASHRSYSLNLQGVQSSDPGFSFEAPSNLRTSLSDRPVSSSRGGSPSSFSGSDMNRRGRRQSISPTPSRRASSYNSNDRDHFGSYSKASARSSAEDDLESMQSIPISYSRSSSPAVRKNLPVMKSRTIASPKKPSKNFYPSSAPKRSFDSAVWLMDQRKAPQDKFRPLLSSVPSTTFGAVKGDDVHSSMLSHDSSFMTSSNLSSEHGVTFGPCMVNDQEQNDVVSQCEATSSSVIHEDIFMFDKLDVLNGGPNCHQCSLSTTQSGPKSPRTVKYAESTIEGLEMEKSRIAQSSCNVASSSEVGHTKMVTCTRCGKLFNEIGDDGEIDFCDECALVDEILFVDPKIQTLEEAHQPDHKIGNSKPCVAWEAPHITPDCIEGIKKSSLDGQLLNDEPQGGCLQKCPESKSTMDTTDRMLSWQHGENVSQNLKPHDIGDSPLGNKIDISSHQCSVSDCQQKEPISVTECDILRDQTANHNNEVSKCLAQSLPESIEFVSDKHTTHKVGSEHLNLKTENTRGAGISVLLLQESSSNKWPVVEGRPLAATNILCSEPYYTKDCVNALKRTIGWDSSSAASSINQGSSRQSVHFERHKSSNHYDFEKSQISSTVSCQSIASMSDMSTSNCSVSICPRRNAIVDIGFLTDNSESSASRTMICTEELDESCKCTLSSAIECWSAAKAIVNDDIDSFGDAIQNLSANTCSSDTETHNNIPLSLAPEESCIQKTEEGTSAVSQCYSVGIPEHPGDECGVDNYQMQYEAVPASNEAKRLDDGCVSVISEEDVLFSATEANTMELPDNEGLLATVEGSREQIQRCFTLEEVTDTILFCSSIAHDIAFRAATIGLEREQQSEFASAPRPTVTMVGQSIPRGDSSLKPTHRRMPRHRKLSEGGTVTETAKMEVVATDHIPVQQVHEFSRTSDSMKPPKIESKCNCAIM
uniref:Proline-rich family protein n=1 Tax=Setaria italica TaxID=4555 RepID=K3Z3A8_SETIT